MSTEEIDFDIVLKFKDFHQVSEFLEDMENWRAYKNRKQEKKLDDKRGAHTAKYHELCRQHNELHPELSYKECMHIVKNKDK